MAELCVSYAGVIPFTGNLLEMYGPIFFSFPHFDISVLEAPFITFWDSCEDISIVSREQMF